MERGFSYERFFKGRTLMVIVPHEDDEINIAAPAIAGAVEEGLRVLCVFLTTGDWDYIPDVRIGEAVKALDVLGVSADNVIFLGYPDGGVHGERSVFVHGRTAPVTAWGANMTRGAVGKSEYYMAETGHHHTCTWDHLLADMERVIDTHRPDGILCVDLDSHPDHRECSIAFETVMGRILRKKDNDYTPVVLKAFAYNTAFEAVEDFYQTNLPSTVINTSRLLNKEGLDNPRFDWDERIRLPVVEACRTQDLGRNKTFAALTMHISQKASRRAGQIINGDEVFWRKRTDSLAMTAEMSASSGDAEALHDFQSGQMKDIVSGRGDFDGKLWVPDEDDKVPWCRCTFAAPRHVESVVFYGNVASGSRILKSRLTFSNGLSVDVDTFRSLGRATTISFPPQDDIAWMQLDILERESSTAGIAEWEIFSEEADCPVLKILAGGHFAYDWMMVRGVPMEISAYNPMRCVLAWSVNGKETTLEDVNRIARSLRCAVTVKVVAKDNPALWDEVIFRPDTPGERMKRKLLLARARLTAWLQRQKEKRPHHKLRQYLANR